MAEGLGLNAQLICLSGCVLEPKEGHKDASVYTALTAHSTGP